MIRFTCFGVKVKISYLIICLISWISLFDDSGVVCCAVLFSILHEVFHVVCLIVFKAKPRTIELTLFGFKIVKTKQLTFLREIIVLSSGCLSNLAALFFCMILKFEVGFMVNLVIIILNILPHEKLDGGQILGIILERKMNCYAGMKISEKISRTVGIIVGIVGLMVLIKFRNVTLLILAVMLYF